MSGCVEFAPGIWFGDAFGISDMKDTAQSVINVAHHIRRKYSYWKNLGGLDWHTWYFRLASPDRNELDVNYIHALENILDSVDEANKYPLLCHCQMGGHRGPAAALFAAWHVNGRDNLEAWVQRMQELRPGFDERLNRRVYLRCLLQYCKNVEKASAGV